MKKISLRLCATVTLLEMGFGSARASDYPIEQNYFQELPVVLTASRLSQPASEAPNAMTVIDREMIKASGFRNIPDLFKLVPGVYVSYWSGSRAIVAYHGTTDHLARRMQVLVDGRTVYMPPVGGVAWEDLPLQIEDIERIEVIRGPAAASHGGNSSQGVINILTRDAGALQGFKASATKGNGGIFDTALHFGHHGETLDYRVSLGYRRDHGYDASRYPVASYDGSEYDPNNDGHGTHLFNLRANYQPTIVDSFDLQLGYSKGARGVGSPNSAQDLPHDSLNTENFQQLTWLRNLNGGNEFKLQLYHIYHIYHNELNTLGWISDDVTTTRDEMEVQHTMHTSPANRLVYGASLRRDWVRAPNKFLAEQSVRESTLFAHGEWRMTPQWILNAGAMLENNGLGQQSTSPRVALNYHFAENQTLRAGLSRAYRNPSVYEERSNYHFDFPGMGTVVLVQSSGGLRPESVMSREIGYLGEFPEFGSSIDARIYHDQLSNVIYITPTAPKDLVNNFNATHSGLEFTTKHHWGGHNQLTINYAYQVLSSSYIPYGTNGSYSDTMPRNMLGALYSRTFAGEVALSLGSYQQSTMQPIDRPADDRQQFTRRADARIAKQFNLSEHGAKGEVALVVQIPITNHYIDYRVKNQFKRRSYLTATLDF
ncbi:MAG: TonB-dependent receptor [Gallionella sp.]|nr:TonB-dependent receptor [Gallionella sp.]